jgi:amidase
LFLASVEQLHDWIASGRVSSRQLVQYYLDRIEKLNRKGPNLRAVINVNPDALQQAARLDEERASRRELPLLYGIPVLIKDNIETKDPVPTTVGSLALANWRSGRDADVVARLREQGAVILGKANMSQWAGLRGPPGWSTTGGQAVNPHNAALTPCGSSSGSAVAVAAAMAPLAVGTETSGSIVCPASSNGIVGLRPSVGLLPTSGIAPISKRQDTPGPMARTVQDAAALLAGMLGASARTALPGIDERLRDDALAGKRLGVLFEAAQWRPEEQVVWREAMAALKAAGATLVELPADWGDASGCAMEVLLMHDLARDLGAYLEAVDATLPVHSLAELVAFNAKNPDEMKVPDNDVLLPAAVQTPPSGDDAEAARRQCIAGAERALAALKDQNLVALVTPTSAPLQQLMAVAGTPYVSVPMGYLAGQREPLGLTFYGAARSDVLLLGLAYGFSAATKSRHIIFPAGIER